jgi:hypothetical protein
LSTLSITSIAAGETAYFTVVPKTGLGVDSNTGLDFEIYTDTVTVSGEHGISTHFDVSFRVYVPGKADIVIAAWVDEDGNLITGNQGPVSISKTAEDTVTVTAAAELENIQWSIDTVPIGPPRGTAGSITIEAANYPVGTYILGLLAYKNGVPYSTTLEVRIDE